MTATASRLGLSPLQLDRSGLGNLKPPFTPDLLAAWKNLKSRLHAQDVGFYPGISDDAISQAKASRALATELLKSDAFEDCLFLGIGGSALGPISALSALHDLRRDKTIRFHFVENPDATDWNATLKLLKPERTLVICVTKSGGTYETIAQFLLALSWLEKRRWKSNVIALTDPRQGDLRKFADAEGIRTLSIHPSLGGRFSIFSPVGIFPMTLAGLDTESFLKGAEQVRSYVDKTEVDKNALFILGSQLIHLYESQKVHVCMPYATRLRLIGDWFVQLWGESLGKEGKGFTPIAALGATDQHSILQLLVEGPNDKVTTFLTIDQVKDEVSIPKIESSHALGALAFLQGHSLHELLTVEQRAIARVLTKRGRPHYSIQLDQLDERSLGALYFAYSVLTAFTGTLWGINPFDQPGVEEGKVYMKELLSQKA